MRPTNQLTPYPVLAAFRDDYLNSSFTTRITGEEQFGNLRIRIDFELREPCLKRLIAEGKAEYAAHIECPSVSYRRYEGTDQDSITITISRSQCKKKVEVCTFVVACQDIAQYRSGSFHPDYEGLSFDLRRGDILAIGQSKQIDITEADDMARRTSILSVMKAGPGQTDSMAVNTDGDKSVLVSLRPDLYDVYALLGDGDQADLILSLVILPALQAVLTRMRKVSDDEEYTEREWYKSITEILARSGLSVDDINDFDEDKSALALAQRMLDEPLGKSLQDLMEMEEVRYG